MDLIIKSCHLTVNLKDTLLKLALPVIAALYLRNILEKQKIKNEQLLKF